MSDPPLQASESSMGSRLSQPSPTTLKRARAASAPCENEEVRQRKRSRANPGTGSMKENLVAESESDVEVVEGSSLKSKGKEKELPPLESHAATFGGATAAVIEDLAQELKCGCCTELCYNPVIVNPCQHYFCGSCCILWVRNGGTNCPACRSISTSVTPSRILQSMIDLLLRSDPTRARTANERTQADQVYRAGTSLRLPTPRPVTPEPNLEPANDNFARPCPTCLPGNAYGWRCPVPIPDPAIDQENAFDLDDGMPNGHNFCGNCDQLHNIHAPTSSKCDMCQVSFCGVGIQGRCCAITLAMQQPQGMTELQDLILSGSVYDCFQKNSVEVDILVDYLRMNEISLRGVYKEIINYTLQKPNGFAPLIELGIFDDLHPVSGGDDPDPSAPRRKICRLCAAQVLLHGLKEWWVRERRQSNLPAHVLARKDCPQGSVCDKQSDQAHANEFNHIIQPAVPTANEPGPASLHEDAVSALLNQPRRPTSIVDPTSSIPPNAEQEHPTASSDVDMLSPFLPQVDPAPSTSTAANLHPSSQMEVEGMTESSFAQRAGSSTDASGSGAGFLAQPASVNPQALKMNGGDVMITEVDDEEATIPQPQVGAPMDPEMVIEMLGPKTPSSSRAHVLTLSPSV